MINLTVSIKEFSEKVNIDLSVRDILLIKGFSRFLREKRFNDVKDFYIK